MTERPVELGAAAPRAGAGAAASRISPVVRIAGLVLGFALAIGATLAVFLTDNALYLRLAVIAVAWAFVIAAFSAGRRKTDQAVAEGRENELRQAYALELEREVAARREYELKLENQLRRETQEAMRAELDKLRADLASLAGLRDQLTGLGELRADMGRLRHELTEQLSGEMLVERIVMRTQSIRMPAERAELGAGDPHPAGGPRVWDADDDLEPPGPALDRPVAADRPPVPERPAVPEPVARPSAPPVPSPPARVAPEAPAPTPFDWLGRAPDPPSRHASSTQEDRVGRSGAGRHGTAEQPRVVSPATPPPPPRAEPPAAADPPASTLWGAADGPAPVAHPHRAPAEEPAPEPEPEPDDSDTAGHQRLTQILAESGSTAGGGRRRRRYRDDDDGDDVLARVLNRP